MANQSVFYTFLLVNSDATITQMCSSMKIKRMIIKCKIFYSHCGVKINKPKKTLNYLPKMVRSSAF
jgi:hypothetical protein